MAIPFYISQITPLTFTFLLIFISFSSSSTTAAAAIDITSLLSPFQNFSSFSSLLSTTSVAADLNQRNSITILAVPNSYLSSSSDITHRLSQSSLADLLRYHVLLQYYSWSDLKKILPSGILVTTLLQTTGRAPSNYGNVNITRNPLTNSITVQSPAPYSSNATVLSLIKTLPYNITILAVNSFLIPYGFDLMASETRPHLNLNITEALINGHNFNVAASLLSASGLDREFEGLESGAGITLFVPTDLAFADLPATVKLQSLSAENKAKVLRFHVLHSYYPLGSLESIVNPLQPTLATELNGAGSFTLNISRINGSVAIDTGLVQASVTQTVSDNNPIAIFGVSEVLLPREIFGKDAATFSPKPGNEGEGSAPPALSPVNSPATHLSSPPLFGNGIGSNGERYRVHSYISALCCIVFLLLVRA